MRLGPAIGAVAAIIPIFLAPAGTSAAERDTFAPEDKAAVDDCLKAARAQTQRLASCIGIASAACQKKPGMESTAGMRDCYIRESAVWEQMLNQRYDALSARLSEASAQKLREIQRAWTAWREEKCQMPYLLYEGGTIAVPSSAYCFMEVTAERALELDEAATTFGAQ